MRLPFILCFCLSLAVLCLRAEQSWEVVSPNGRVAVQIETADLGTTAAYPAGQRLYFQVSFGEEGSRHPLLLASPLGIARQDEAFLEDLTFEGRGDLRRVDEDYRLLHGKKTRCTNQGSELTLTFRNQAGQPLQLVFRAYNDGVAFRYHFPDKKERQTVIEEATGFRIPQTAVGFLQPHDNPSQWTPAYEQYFMREVGVGTTSPIEAGWSFPALFHLEESGHWVLITEADLDGGYFGSRLAAEAPHGVYRIRMPDEGEGNGTGTIRPSATLPWSTPWRVIMTGDSLAAVFESTLVTDVSRPSVVRNTNWIKPGRVSWGWWSDNDSPKNYETLREFVDLAAEMGWEYSLVDANWTEMDDDAIPRLVRYAREKGVEILLWYNSGGPHNIVTEKPRDRMHERDARRRELQRLRDWGVKGVKVDFFQSDKQNIIQHYLDILEDTAEYQIMVNFHGCTLPRGWSRTYPHLLTMEAVRGAESYIYDEHYPERAPWHNTILPFTRNVVGSMDYTPVALSDRRHPHLTTYGHELALAVVYESAWQHFADSVSAYRAVPGFVRDFLRGIPAGWDDSKLLAGEPGKQAVLARRKGDDWYVGGINGEESAATVRLNFSFLEQGDYRATIITDGNDDRSFQESSFDARRDNEREVRMRPRGGFVIRLSR
jgi:alpha-glucosidase